MYAACYGRWEVVIYLISSGASTNFNNTTSVTPLMVACASPADHEDDIVKCVRTLLENGAEINARGTRRFTSLVIACAQGRQ